jgi:type IV pilus assembly protein PilA
VADSPRAAAIGSGSPALVAAAERSKHFDPVNNHLELGGTLYGYVDIDGDIGELAAGAQALVHQVAASQPLLGPLDKQDIRGLFAEMGLNDVKALGFSSVRQANGIFRNRTFLYTPEGRHGFFAAFGGQPGGFAGAKMAPADADFYSECELDLTAVYDTVKKVVTKAAGPDAAAALDKQLKATGAEGGFSLLDVIEGLNGRGIIIVRLDPDKTFTVPGPKPAIVPAFTLLVRIDGIGPPAEGAIAKAGTMNETTEGSLHVFSLKKPLPVPGLQPTFAVDGKALYFATSPDFLHECIGRSSGLDANPAFVAGMAALGPQGNGVTWVSPRFFKRISDISALNPQADADSKRVFAMFAAHLPVTTEPLLSVRTNLPDGILIRSNWNRSLKSDVALFSIYNPVTVGLMAAMAIPAFQKVRTASQEKTVLNNLRMLDAAADQFYLETGQTTATYDQLVGPSRVVKQVTVVAGEDYRSLIFRQGLPLRVRLSDGRMISYPQAQPQQGPYHQTPYPQAAPRAEVTPRPHVAPVVHSQDVAPRPPGSSGEAMLENLRKLNDAAEQFYTDHDTTTTTFYQLVGPDKYLPSITPVAGEDYRPLLFKKGHPLRLYLKDGRVIVFPPQ